VKFTTVFFLCVILTFQLSAQISVTQVNLPVQENFDGMGYAANGTTSSYPTGWTGAKYSGTSSNPAVGTLLGPIASDGSSFASGTVFNIGTLTLPDRALGLNSTGVTVPVMGASFINSTGAIISSIDFSATHEQWATGSSNAEDEVVNFEISFDATSLLTGTWIPVSGMDLKEILTTSTIGGAIDGNNASNRISISSTVQNLNWQNGTTMWIRWLDSNANGTDGTYAVDDFSMTPFGVPSVSDGVGSATIQNLNTGVLNNTDIFKNSDQSASLSIKIVGVNTGVLEGVQIILPSSWNNGISATDISLSGLGVFNSNFSVSGDTITVTSAVISNLYTGIISINSGIKTPDTSSPVSNDGNFSFDVKTRVNGGNFTSINLLPTAYVTIPIINLRAQDANFISLDFNHTVAVEGTATVDNGVFSNSDMDVYIQDNTAGINIYQIGGAGNTVMLGEAYIAKGVVEQPSGKTRLKIFNFSNFIDDGAGILPAINSNVYDIASLKTTAKAELLEGSLIGIQNITISGVWPTNNVSFSNLVVDDLTGTITLRCTTSNAGSIDLTNTPLEINGILIQFDVIPYDAGYEIMTRSASDFLQTGTLPVEMISLKVINSQTGKILHWETKSETNNSGWEIESRQRTIDNGQQKNTEFRKIGFVTGKGTTTEKQEYSFLVSNTQFSASVVEFRLKQIDFNGKFSYSKILSVEAVPENFELTGNYPNPFNPQTVIRFNLPSESFVTLKVYDVLGREVSTLLNKQINAGGYSVLFNASGYSTGIYFYSITAFGKTITKSMTVMK